ncbi:hypothetical protein COO60DRAFT_1661215 [Scenedesmus sp. NREL 46B-D3]|nr:hypothetical protein COO60DRAFT_1661215 [Scenedesmus sp. NREL 46B-D3]
MPDIHQRPNIGIAVSGGGLRAATLALGYVRALHLLGLTHQARYLASNSGGSWFSAPFSYQQVTVYVYAVMPVDVFLGPYLRPQDLSLASLADVGKGAQGAFAATLAASGIVLNAVRGAVGDAVTGSRQGPGAWSNSVGAAYLEPYGLNADESTVTANGTAGPVHAALRQLPGIAAYTYQGSFDSWTRNNTPRPFPIILGSLIGGASPQSSFYPVEFSPLYTGSPPVHINCTDPARTIGGGFVDPQGFNSAPPDPAPEVPAALAAAVGADPTGFDALVMPPPAAAPTAAKATNSSGRALLQAPGLNSNASTDKSLNSQLPLTTAVTASFVVPLKVVVGISSSFLAQLTTPEKQQRQERTGTEDLDYWNQVNFKGQRQLFADGAGTDNLAVTPLLRRRVQAIVACVASVEPLLPNTTADHWAAIQWDVSGLFGAVPLQHKSFKAGKVLGTGSTPEQLNRASQVFPTSAWPELYGALNLSVAQGGPAHHLADYTVQDNPYLAVHGGWQVRVLWVFNAQQTNWEQQLPADTRALLDSSRTRRGGLYDQDGASDAERDGKGKPELKMFPYISTLEANYSPELVGLLSQQATWQLLQLQEQLGHL